MNRYQLFILGAEIQYWRLRIWLAKSLIRLAIKTADFKMEP